MWDSVVILIGGETSIDEAGDIVEDESTKKQIFCNELSIGQNEFYQAAASGFKPELKLEIYKSEYSNEKQAIYCEVLYSVIRTFSKKDSEVLELTLGSGVNGNSSK